MNVTQLLAINLTTGWQSFTPLNQGILRNSTITYPLFQQRNFQPATYSEVLLFPNCTLGTCPYIGNIPIILTSRDKRDFLGIHWTLSYVTSELSMSATLWDEEKHFSINGTLLTEFNKQGERSDGFRTCVLIQFKIICWV